MNYLRQAVLPAGAVAEWVNAVIAVVIAATLFVLITAVHRAVRRRRSARERRRG